MKSMKIKLTSPVDNLCDYTFDFFWQHEGNRLDIDGIIPFQDGSRKTYRDIVKKLRKGKKVIITGNVGERLGYCMGVDLAHFGGSGNPEKAGTIIINGDVGIEMGMAMVSGDIYVSGRVQEPLGNIIEIESDRKGYRRFKSITDIMNNGLGYNRLVGDNIYELDANTLILRDGIMRNTLASRCVRSSALVVEGDVGNGCGMYMQTGILKIKGNAGINTGAHLDGGNMVVKGDVGEFAGAYMKGGALLINGDTKGYVGANMKEGTIYLLRAGKTNPPVVKKPIDNNDVKKLTELGVSLTDVKSYSKYVGEEPKYETVRMRDGSVVQRKI